MIKYTKAELSVCISLIVSGLFFVYLTNLYAVNVLFYDQWDFLTPLFGKPTFWEMFTFQHGPHRQGIGLFVSSTIGNLTAWDTRAEGYAVVFILMTAAILGVWLKERVFGKIEYYDILIPVIILTPTQIETAVLTANPAHGALPLLFIIIFCLLLTAKNPYLKYFGLVLINFLTIFTGFGIFLGLLTPLVLIVSAFFERRNKQVFVLVAVCLILSILSFALFFQNYVFAPAADCFEFPYHKPLRYFQFIGAMIGSFVGFLPVSMQFAAIPFGLIILLAVILIGISQLPKLFKTQSIQPLIILTLISFSLLFAVNATIGRVCIGIAAAQGSRYMTLLVPLFFGCFLWFCTLEKGILKTNIFRLMCLLFILTTFGGVYSYQKTMKFYADAKQKWALCYLQTESIENCDEFAGHKIYPEPEKIRLTEKLESLKKRKLNLFKKSK